MEDMKKDGWRHMKPMKREKSHSHKAHPHCSSLLLASTKKGYIKKNLLVSIYTFDLIFIFF